MTTTVAKRQSDAAAFSAALGGALQAAVDAADCEAALRELCRAAYSTLGDHTAAMRPGALQDGERDYRVAGVFLITPDRAYNMLVGNVGFPAEQRRLMIPIEWNHPGRVVTTGTPILVADTDAEAGRFRQFLKSSRMGSSIYFPIRVGGVLVGQIVAAAQARGTYDGSDLARLGALAAAAALVWRAHDGSRWLADDYPAADAWRAEEHVQGERIA